MTKKDKKEIGGGRGGGGAGHHNFWSIVLDDLQGVPEKNTLIKFLD